MMEVKLRIDAVSDHDGALHYAGDTAEFPDEQAVALIKAFQADTALSDVPLPIAAEYETKARKAEDEAKQLRLEASTHARLEAEEYEQAKLEAHQARLEAEAKQAEKVEPKPKPAPKPTPTPTPPRSHPEPAPTRR